MEFLCDNYYMNKLFTDKMNFQPSLPAPKTEIMKRMPISLLNKVIITYDKVSLLNKVIITYDKVSLLNKVIITYDKVRYYYV